MNAMTITHPTNPDITATLGFDHAIKFFVDITSKRRRFSYSAIEPGYDHERPLWGALRFLAAHGFYTEDDLHDALSGLQDGTIDELPERVQQVGEVVWAFKRAAD